MYLSLSNSHTFDKVSFNAIPHLDKIVHFSMYFGLMSAIIFENRKSLKEYRSLLLTAIIPLFYGILLEIFQGVFTTTRSASFYDALANAAGILVSLLLWMLIRQHLKEEVR
jgi:VanZ family protein